MARKFKFHLCFGNLKKDNIELPIGYKYNNEKTIINSDGTKASKQKGIGVVIETRQLSASLKDIKELKKFISVCFDNGGVKMWNAGFDGRIVIDDLGVEDLKKIFVLGHYVKPFLAEVFKLNPIFDDFITHGLPSVDMVKRIKNQNSLAGIKNVLSNSSEVGYWKFPINIMTFFESGELEYLVFNGTNDFNVIIESIRFMNSFLEYALKNEEDNFMAIKNKKTFIDTFKIKKGFSEHARVPIFASDEWGSSNLIAKAFQVNKNLACAIAKSTGENIYLVNPFNFYLEISLHKLKKITVFNNNEFNHVIYKIIKEGLVIDYSEQYKILNENKNGTAHREIILFFIFNKIRKFNLDQDYGLKEFLAIVNRIDDSINKLKESADSFISLFDNCDYIFGGLNEAIDMAVKTGAEIIYQQEKNSKSKSTFLSLKKNSNYKEDIKAVATDYRKLNDNLNKLKQFIVISKNRFLDLNKIAMDGGAYIYSNKSAYTGIRTSIKNTENYCVDTPKDDYIVDFDSGIKIVKINIGLFSYLQKKHVKKVYGFRTPAFRYMVTDKNNLSLGAFGFDFMKNTSEEMLLLSDFCTNNNIKLLSKLIILLIKTKEVKKILSRDVGAVVVKGRTKVYTTQAVSMKYRGVFEKISRDEKSITYGFDLGSGGSINDAISEYKKRVKNSKK